MRPISHRILSLTLACTLMGLFVCSGFTGTSRTAMAAGTAQSHLDKARQARQQAAAQDAKAEELKVQINKLDAQAEKYALEAQSYDPKIKTANAKASALLQQLIDLKKKAEALRQQINDTQAQYQKQQAELSKRVTESYKNGDDFYLELIFGAESIADLISRAEMLSRFMIANSQAAAQLNITKRKLESEKVQLAAVVDDAQAKSDEAARNAKNLKTMQASKQNAADASEAMQNQKTTLMKSAEKNADKLRALAEEEEATAAKITAELAARAKGSGKFSGSMVWPVPASHRVTSPFGYRICPFHGRELHPGIDIGAPSGSAIVAAGSGTVISAGWRGGYGNTVIIDHGNGVTTLYAHQLSGGIRVGVGSHVKAGQRIGTVGSTGNSTGPHLHWEVRVNGEPRNPMSY